MEKGVKTPDITIDNVSFTLLAQKIGSDNKMKGVIRIRPSNKEGSIVNRDTSIRFEQMRRFWEKLIKLPMTEHAKFKKCH